MKQGDREMNIKVKIETEKGEININKVTKILVDIITPRPELSQTYNLETDKLSGGYTMFEYKHCLLEAYGVDLTNAIMALIEASRKTTEKR
jgi:hypothetical protein